MGVLNQVLEHHCFLSALSFPALLSCLWKSKHVSGLEDPAASSLLSLEVPLLTYTFVVFVPGFIIMGQINPRCLMKSLGERSK